MLAVMLRIPLQAFTSRKATTCPALGRAALLSVLTGAAALLFASSSLALSGLPIQIAQPQKFKAPSVAVDAAGTAYIAWVNTQDLENVHDEHEGELIEYCVLPAGAAACAYKGQLQLGDGPGGLFGPVKVLVDSGKVIIFADEVHVNGPEYEDVQEWQAPEGSGTFTIQLGGKSVASSHLVSGTDTDDDQPVIVPGTGELGLGGGELSGPEKSGLVDQPSFQEFPLAPSVPCSESSCPAAETPVPLEAQSKRETEKYGQSVDGYASVTSGPTAGILGVYNVSSSQNECGGEDFYQQLGFVFGEGTNPAAYGIAAGKPGTAWTTPLTHADCNVSNIAVTAGPSGYGVVENEGNTNYVVYHTFDRADRSFDTPISVISRTETESSPSLSQDGSGGIYLTYNDFYGTELAYSSNGGASWTGPSQLVANIGGLANATSNVGPSGQGWLVWTNEESVYAQQFVASDAVTPPPPPPPPASKSTPPPLIPNSGYTIESIVPNSNGTVTITFVPTQSGEATLVVTVPTASIASVSATAAKSKKCKHGQVEIKGKCRPSTTSAGRTSASGTAGVPLKLTVNLSSKIKSLLKKGKTVHLTATLTYTSSLGGAPTKHTYNLTVKGHKPKHK
jgi:hypothetical protein